MISLSIDYHTVSNIYYLLVLSYVNMGEIHSIFSNPDVIDMLIVAPGPRRRSYNRITTKFSAEETQ